MTIRITPLLAALIAGAWLGAGIPSLDAAAARPDKAGDNVYQNVPEEDATVAAVQQQDPGETLPLQEESSMDDLPPADAESEEHMMDDYQPGGPPIVAWPGGRR